VSERDPKKRQGGEKGGFWRKNFLPPWGQC
jgi:hypothetical protein